MCCNAGYVDNTPIMDLNYAEECSNCPDMPVAIMPNSGIQADADALMRSAEGRTSAGGGAGAAAMDEGDGAGAGAREGESIVVMQLDRRLPLDLFEEVLGVATDGARQIYSLLKEEVRRYTVASMDARGSVGL